MPCHACRPARKQASRRTGGGVNARLNTKGPASCAPAPSTQITAEAPRPRNTLRERWRVSRCPLAPGCRPVLQCAPLIAPDSRRDLGALAADESGIVVLSQQQAGRVQHVHKRVPPCRTDADGELAIKRGRVAKDGVRGGEQAQVKLPGGGAASSGARAAAKRAGGESVLQEVTGSRRVGRGRGRGRRRLRWRQGSDAQVSPCSARGACRVAATCVQEAGSVWCCAPTRPLACAWSKERVSV